MHFRILILSLLMSLGFQGHTQYYNPLTFSPAQMQADLDILQKLLYTDHPGVFLYTSREKLDAAFLQVRNGLKDSLWYNTYRIRLSGLLTQIGCGHTTISPPEFMPKDTVNAPKVKVLPLRLVHIDNQRYVTPLNGTDTLIPFGSRLLAVNNIPADTLIRQFQKVIPRDGLHMSFVQRSVDLGFPLYYFMYYRDTDSFRVKVHTPEGRDSVYVLPATTLRQYYTDNAVNAEGDTPPRDLVATSTSWGAAFVDSADPSIGILRLRSFGDDYTQFYDQAFLAFEEKNVKALVIDLRDNGGGSVSNAVYLLRYLLLQDPEAWSTRRDKPEMIRKYYLKHKGYPLTSFMIKLMAEHIKDNDSLKYVIRETPATTGHFDGPVYVLINGYSFSSACYLAAQLKYLRHALLIGEESGGTASGCNAMFIPYLELPNTRMQVRFPVYRFDHKLPVQNDGRGLIPDHEIHYGEADIVARRDLEMDKVRALVLSVP